MQLISTLVKMEKPENKQEAKLELMEIVSGLMPAGRADYLAVVKYPAIAKLKETQGKKNIIKAVFLLVKDFCDSMNVVRNMNEEQMIEAAAMLTDECGTFRLEDYLAMFAMAKRGKLVKIYDRIDMQVISGIVDAYDVASIEAAQNKTMEEANRIESLGPSTRLLDDVNPQDAQAIEMADKLMGTIERMKSAIQGE